MSHVGKKEKRKEILKQHRKTLPGFPRMFARGQHIFFPLSQVPWSPAPAASIYPRVGCLQSVRRLGRSLCAASVVDAKRKHHPRAPAPGYPHRAQIRKPGWPSLLSPNQKSPKIPSIVLSRVHLIRSWHFFRERTAECVCRVLKGKKKTKTKKHHVFSTSFLPHN